MPTPRSFIRLRLWLPLLGLLALILAPPAALAARGNHRADKLDPEQQPMHLERGSNGMAETHKLDIRRGNSTVLTTAYATERVAVGDPTIVDFIMHGNREIQIVAKNVGDTNLLVWSGGRLQSVLDIHVGTVHQHVVDEIRRILDNPSIEVEVAGSSIILHGWVADLDSFEKAEMVALAYLGHTDISTGKGKFDASNGRVKRQVINLIEVGGNQQVMIEVVIAELQKTLGRSLGVNMFGAITLNKDQQITFQTLLKNLTKNSNAVIAPGVSGPTVFADAISLAGTAYSSGDFDLRLFLEAVEASQLGTILAEPTVIARSGELASFLVGGEVPIPILVSTDEEGGKYTVKFKKFGVRVDFTPTVKSNGRIHLQLLSEVSEPDFSLGVRVLGSSVPAFKTRRVDTSVDLADGQSFAVAGLLREDIFVDLENFPGLGSIPILGQLFRSRSFQKKQTELVMIITPRLVKPLSAGVHPLPTDQYIEPSKAEFYWGGLIQGKKKKHTGDDALETDELAGHDPSAVQAALSEAVSGADQAATASQAEQATPEIGGAVQPEAEPESSGESQQGKTVKMFGDFGHRLKVPTPTEEES